MDADKHLTARAGPQQVSGPFDLAAPGTAGHSVLPWGREAKGSHSRTQTSFVGSCHSQGWGRPPATPTEQQSRPPTGTVVPGPAGRAMQTSLGLAE